MDSGKIYFITLLALLGRSFAQEAVNYSITKTWNGQELDSEWQHIHITFSPSYNGTQVDGIKVLIDAPWYDLPKVPPETPAGWTDGLWDYEVVEVFLLGENEKYLELEFGPEGHYLIYYLEGVRNVTNEGLRFDEYNATIYGGIRRWIGSAVVPLEFLPPKIDKFNAYAIHNYTDAGEEFRRYMALYPAPDVEGEEPDFHKLELFQTFPIEQIVGKSNDDNGSPSHFNTDIFVYLLFGMASIILCL